MTGKSCFCVLLLLAAGCQAAFARLGESPQAIEQRYGPPLTTGSLTGFTQCAYQKQAFRITVFYQNGISVLETFTSRGMDQATAREVVVLVAASSIGSPDQAQECKIRQASGITNKDEVFWTWKNASQQVNAAFNPLECTLAFFGDPAVYAGVHEALANAPLPGG
jgi:hypothetical protein